MLLNYKNGQTSIVLRVKLRDATSSSGAGLTGLTSASAGLIIGTIADNEATTTRYRASSSEVEAVSALGTFAAPTSGKCRFSEVDATNHPGVYEIHLANARYAVSSAKSLLVSFSGATNLAQCDVLIPLTSFDPYDAVRAGLTALPNAASGANGSLPVTSSSNTTLAYTLSTLTTYTGNTVQTGDNYARLGAPAGASHAADVAAVKSDTAAVKAKTDNLPADPSSAATLSSSFSTVNTTLSTIAGYVDTEVAAIKAKTDLLTFTTSGKVDAKLTSDGLDNIATTAPSGMASSLREMIVQIWRRDFKKVTLTASQMKTYGDDGSTVLTTQVVSDDGTVQTQGAGA